MSLTGETDGEPYRAGVALFDVMAGLHATIGVLAALNHRHETGAGQHIEVNLLVLGALGPGEPDQRVRRRRGRPVPDGQQPPEPVPVRAAAVRRRRADHHRRQRRAVPPALRGAGAAGAGRRPALPAQRGPHRQPRRAAAAAGRAAAHPAEDGVVPRDHRRRACRAGRSTPSTRAWPSPRRWGSTPSSPWARATAAVPSVRNPITFSATAAEYRLPPPTLDEHGDELRRWLAAPAGEEASA